jgi:hypothetical protein
VALVSDENKVPNTIMRPEAAKSRPDRASGFPDLSYNITVEGSSRAQRHSRPST